MGFFFLFVLHVERTQPTACIRQPCLIYVPTSIEARLRERIDRGWFLPFDKKASSLRGAMPLSNCFVRLFVCSLFFIFCFVRVFAAALLIVRHVHYPFCTKPWRTGASELTLTRGTCLIASRLELVEVAVACLVYELYIDTWCVDIVIAFANPIMCRTSFKVDSSYHLVHIPRKKKTIAVWKAKKHVFS